MVLLLDTSWKLPKRCRSEGTLNRYDP